MITLFKDNMKAGKYKMSEKEFKKKFDKYVKLERLEDWPLARQIGNFTTCVLSSTYDSPEYEKMEKAARG